MKKIIVAALAVLFALTTACSTPEDLRAAQNVPDCQPAESEVETADTDSSLNSEQSNAIISAVEAMVAEYCKAEISQIEVQNLPESVGSCLTMVLVEDDVENVKMSDLDRLYIDLEIYSKTVGMKQCFITVQDTTGKIMLDLTGDFGVEESIWFNPNYQDILVNIGPPTPDELGLDGTAASNSE